MTNHGTMIRLVLSAATLWLCGGTVSAQQVGTAAAVNPASTVRDVAGAMRTIVIGQSIAHQEHIQTSAVGSVQLFNLIADWAPDEATRRKILVDNPAALFGF